MSTTNIGRGGNVKELSESQEKVLKQVWTYLLQSWGVPVNGDKAFAPTEGTAPASAENKKGKSLLSRLQSYSIGDDSSNDDTEEAQKYKPDLIQETLTDVKPKDTMDTFWTMLRVDYPDNLLLRFIRARKWNTNEAATMFAQSMRWRINEFPTDKILNDGERKAYENDDKGFIKNLELQTTVIPCRDNGGRPAVWVRARLHSPKIQSEDELKRSSILVIETARLFLTEAADTATIFFDLGGFSLSNMDYTPVKFLINCFEAHYPECLGHLFIHKAPWFFQPIWNIVKNWLDPVVASKVIFTKNTSDLVDYFDEDQIPRYLDGTNDYDFDHYVKPDASNDVKMQDEKTRDSILEERQQLIEKFTQATVKWIEADSKEESSNFLEQKIDLGTQISENYCKLDPYVRSRSQYDTRGILKI
ncbi:ZYRO0B12056p [Zygosaccharomyces rouxii]|uniref:ZYRO0B12056p n=1 Tax=Zygosaccharomyces rouxii (strain ATCC 2623 / CBS 732 / NBRC 1130 / NCYC 568 / NRRL Y-229) TaxID=559307 RepID=C5DRX3_ZYGRC|nr:uncharacterized protein ZYRO0B12056g [Zygosaccharomyces rouxii]KAH9199936.1 CRAL-TRIO domain-containing protein [Zygosaccharomyces rouxii]CAR26534.1 ZYRO0B12056p [Zygosaccharomyces rouxii]